MSDYITKKKKPKGLKSLGRLGRAGRALKDNPIKSVTEDPFKGYEIKDSDIVIIAPKKDKYSKGGRANLRGGGISQKGLGRAFKKGGKV